MKNRLLFFSFALFFCSLSATVSAQIVGSRMKEIFKLTTLSPGSGATQLNDPWEIAYGPDGYLWVTESKGYKVYRINPSDGTRTMVLDLNHYSTDLSAWGADSLRAVNDTVSGLSRLLSDYTDNNTTPDKYPQGGCAGLAIHPQFLNPDSAFVYISYIHRFLGGTAASYSAGTVTPAATAIGNFYRNKLVRFKYNTATGKLGEPAVLCDTLPGGSDHSSQRIIVAPVVTGGANYVFYACGDMGAGQYENRYRTQKAQIVGSYEGKILRFNTKSDGDAGGNAWIPNDNPYGASSAVYSIGIRNNQGFAYDSTTNKLYGSSHGPYSDDEINVIEPHKNYGHPLVIGFAADGNYNGTTTANANTSITAGEPYRSPSLDYGNSANPPIGNEQTNANTLTANGNGEYMDPLFSGYPTPLGTIGTSGIAKIWGTNQGNAGTNWSSEAWSGLDIYQNTLIPGWNRSLVASSLKWSRLIRLKLGTTGTTTLPSNIGGAVGNVGDTISYFDSQNRFRDIAFSPDGRDIFIIMDKSSSTSGPSANNPLIPTCAGCLVKYTFLGYAMSASKSSIPTSIAITSAATNQCITGTTVVIDDDNKNLWVPITGPDGNILAEVYPNGQSLGTITSSFYLNGGTVRSKSGKRYLDRNITITPQNQPSGNVKIRLYITDAEYLALKNASGSAVSTFTDIKIFKNSDVCGSAMNISPGAVTMDFNAEAFGSGYVLQGTISGFSTFYFGSNSLSTLPLDLVTFTGTLQTDNSVLLKWKTQNEINTSSFELERSADGTSFNNIGSVIASGTSGSNTTLNYSYIDKEVSGQLSPVLYYRLKMIDIDGNYSYSNIVAIVFNTVTGKMKVSPNPTAGIINLNLTSNSNEKVHWKLTDNTGKVLLQNTIQLRAGNNNWAINVSRLAAGTYYLSISGTGIDQKVKVQKL